MKTILAEAINGIDWDSPESISYILHNKKDLEGYFVDNILLYLTEISKRPFCSKMLIDGVRKQKVDLIEINPALASNHFIVDAASKEQIKVARLVEFGFNTLLQPIDYNINKTLSDIKRRVVSQKMKNELYTVQIVLELPKITKENVELVDDKLLASNKIEKLDADYKTLDADFMKISMTINEEMHPITLHFYICGAFNTQAWESIADAFKSYKTTKGTSLTSLN